MTTNEFRSVGHTTSNENRREEISFEYHRTLWQWITRRPATVTVFERYLGAWYNKNTGAQVDWYGTAMIDRAKKELKYMGKISQWD